MRKKFLLGATKNKEIVFSEVELRDDRNGKMEFSASFGIVYPFEYDEEYLKERLENSLSIYDKSDLYDLCDTYDCSPNQLADCMYTNSTIEDIVDISLYPNCIEVNGNDWYFESYGWGQNDTREEMEFYVNEKLYNRIMELWDKYHLNEIDNSIVEEVNSIIEELQKVDEEEWIRSFIVNECL